MKERLLGILAAVPEAAAALPPYLLLLRLRLVLRAWVPFLLSLLVRKGLWPTVRRRTAGRARRCGHKSRSANVSEKHTAPSGF